GDRSPAAVCATHPAAAARPAHRVRRKPAPVLYGPPPRRRRVPGVQRLGRHHEPVDGRRLHRDPCRPEHRGRRLERDGHALLRESRMWSMLERRTRAIWRAAIILALAGASAIALREVVLSSTFQLFGDYVARVDTP